MSRRSWMVLAGLVVIVFAWTSTAGANWSPSKKPAKPTVLTKMTKSTQDLWNKTKDALTPGKPSKKPKGRSHKTPSMMDRMKPWFPEKKKRSPTVEDWLPLPRPGM